MTHRFFSSTEANAAARDFTYDDYVRMCGDYSETPLCRPAYDLIKLAFNLQLDFDMRESQS